MADNVDAIRVAADGGKCYVAPLGSPLPQGLDPFGPEWWDLGVIDPSGLTEAYEEERSEHRPLGYKSAVRTDIISVTKTFTTPMWETNPYTTALYDNVPLSALEELPGGIVRYPVYRPTGQRKYMLAVDTFDGTNHIRTVVPIAEVTSRAEITRGSESPVGYNLTWTAYEDSNGLLFERFYLANGMWLPVEIVEITGTATVSVSSSTNLTATARYFNEDVAPKDVTAEADWDTSDPEVAIVEEGVVTGVSAGTATITAAYRGVSNSLVVTVTA